MYVQCKLLNAAFDSCSRTSKPAQHRDAECPEGLYFTAVVFSEREPTFTFAVCYRRSVCRLSVYL